jgi:hypothetical protein
MTDVEYKITCVLCGQSVEIEGFTLASPQGVLKFCCAGCLCIYRLLATSDSTTSMNDSSKKGGY